MRRLLLLFVTMLLTVLASEFLEDWDDLSRLVHTLHVAIKAGLDLAIISRLTAVCPKIVGQFKHSVVAMSAILIKQQNMNIAQHALIEDVATTVVRPVASPFHSDTGSARRATFQCVINAINTS